MHCGRRASGETDGHYNSLRRRQAVDGGLRNVFFLSEGEMRRYPIKERVDVKVSIASAVGSIVHPTIRDTVYMYYDKKHPSTHLAIILRSGPMFKL